MTVQEFISKHNLAITFEAYTPDASEMKRWTDNHRHYKITLMMMEGTTCHRHIKDIEYHTPKDNRLAMRSSSMRDAARNAMLASLLDCLASDCRTARDHDTWEEMASEFIGDVMKAPYGEVIEHKRIYEACELQAKKLRRFLGDDAFRELLDDVESL